MNPGLIRHAKGSLQAYLTRWGPDKGETLERDALLGASPAPVSVSWGTGELNSACLLCRPVILDPADPTGNVAGGNPEGWRRLAEEADVWVWYPCFIKKDGSRVSSWDVPVRPHHHPVHLHTASVTQSIWRLFSLRCGLLLKDFTLCGGPADNLILQPFQHHSSYHGLAR